MKENKKRKVQILLKTVGTMAIGGIIALSLPNLFNSHDKKEHSSPLTTKSNDIDDNVNQKVLFTWFPRRQQQ